MSYSLVGILSIICGLVGIILRKNIVNHRAKLYSELIKTKDPEKIRKAKDDYRIAVIMGSIFLILFGLWLLLK